MSSGGARNFPFKYRHHDDFKHLKIVQHCMKQDKVENIEPCLPYCQKFQPFGYSSEWEGKLSQIDFLYNFVLSVVRKAGF